MCLPTLNSHHYHFFKSMWHTRYNNEHLNPSKHESLFKSVGINISCRVGCEYFKYKDR